MKKTLFFEGYIEHTTYEEIFFISNLKRNNIKNFKKGSKVYNWNTREKIGTFYLILEDLFLENNCFILKLLDINKGEGFNIQFPNEESVLAFYYSFEFIREEFDKMFSDLDTNQIFKREMVGNKICIWNNRKIEILDREDKIICSFNP